MMGYLQTATNQKNWHMPPSHRQAASPQTRGGHVKAIIIGYVKNHSVLTRQIA